MTSPAPERSRWVIKNVLRKKNSKQRSKSFIPERTPTLEEINAVKGRHNMTIPNEDFTFFYDDMESLGLDARAGATSSGRREYGSLDSRTTTLVDRKGSRQAADTEMMHNIRDFDEKNDDEFSDDEASGRHQGSRPFLPEIDDHQCDPALYSARAMMIASLFPDIWSRIARFLTPADAANLTLASRTIRERLGSVHWRALDLEENKHQRVEFLLLMDRYYPNHLLCFPCAKYHVRSKPGDEKLTSSHVLNPIFVCPNVKHIALPRTRLDDCRSLPFALVQLAMRAHRFRSPNYGISLTAMTRRWKCPNSEWSHASRCHISKGHLYLKEVSTAIAKPDMTPSEQRMFLYTRSDYEPYFSCCAHWQDGILMNLCKCALSHIPRPRVTYIEQLKRAPRLSKMAANPDFIVRLCDDCRPMRRCPKCPTEYLLQLKVVEDKTDPMNTFKHALVVTRWSDLGDGSSPSSPEWAACNGKNPFYDSFGTVGRRTLSGLFEADLSNTPAGETVRSLNPDKVVKGEDGDDWY